MGELFTWLTGNWKDITLIITGIVTVASIIVKLTPSPLDDVILAWVVKILKFLSLNK